MNSSPLSRATAARLFPPNRRALSLALMNAITAAGLATFGAPGAALADGCQLYSVNGHISCYLNTYGSAGSPAGSSGSDPIFDDKNGYTGGPGGPAADINLLVAGSPTLYDYSQYDSKGNLLVASSPVNAVSVGGAGAQGSDATAGGFDKVGGNGGLGNSGGDLTVTVGPQVTNQSQDTVNGISGITLISLGGEGGAAGKGNMSGEDGTSGVGGVGGTINATLDGFTHSNFRSVLVSSQGGAGGRGRDYGTGLNSQGADATDGIGGNGGTVTTTFANASNNANNGFVGTTGVLVQSVGGDGGNGGSAEDVDGSQGGSGGLGGNGGNVGVTVGSNVIMVEAGNNDSALHLLSQGGAGGQGNSSGGSGGNAGAGGNGGNVSLTIDGTAGAGGAIAANGTYAPAVLVQSLGGNGGDGGVPSQYVIGPNGGSGSNGGTAGTVSVTGSGLVARTGIYVDPTDFEGSPGVLAQSIGGGGGSGGVSKGVFAVGGEGANGVNGNTATVAVQSQTETFGFGSDGLAVQSIGGGGGKGGDASGDSVGLQYVVGGSAGGGGDGFTASLTSQKGSTVLTHGVHSPGLLAQSIGGGGGQGGSAYSKSKSAGFGASMAVGGSGGAGGNACGTNCTGTTAENDGRIGTDGSDSYGILAQSIGGGGGAGGASTAKSQVYAAEDVSISLSASLGGSGGQAGSGGLLSATNTGLITTGGEGAVGMLAQSIGGGGGAGGDSSSASTATGGEFDISATMSLGGKGGTAGDGGGATGTNNGLVLTTGESAAGMLVQSVGGGGGAGGTGDGQAKSTGGDTTISTTLTMGGTGGSGGDGYGATANNIGGSIITLGDGAFGIGAQSIGGGGGAGGGAAGSSKGSYVATVTMGANGGKGGSTYHIDGNGNETDGVSVHNDATSTVVTFGADANGIVAQSIGGGGGIGGKAGSNIGTKKSDTAGGNSGGNAAAATSTLTKAYDANGSAALNDYMGLNNAVTFTSSLLADATSQVAAKAATAALGDDDLDTDLNDAAESKGETDDDNESSSIQLSVALGASGGSGGSAGLVNVQNDGGIATLGNHSDAILAQAIGGGGGKGGAASTASTNDYSGNLSVGGSGGGGGYGGQVIVGNTGAIYTKGSLAAGIVAESIAGGGGVGGVSASSVKSSSKDSGDDDANDGAFKSIALSVGGNGGSSFDSGQVQVSSSGAISTAAHDSSGIIAQSITGGGGIAKTLASDLEGAGGSASAKGGKYDVSFKFGGSSGEASGGSGLVNVTTTTGGAITTAGDNSYGILAQSISGGGGVQLGGTVTGSTVADFFGSGKTSGSVNNDGVNSPTSGNSGLSVTVGDAVTTSGANAVGVLAQSIGGGGGVAGGIAGQASLAAAPQYFSGSRNATGNGGVINATVNAGATVSTTGNNAPAMVLQSLGGGGGRVITDNALYMGTAGGSGTGGAITATIDGTVNATGAGSAGIVAQSMGDSASNAPISITIASTGKVTAGQDAVPTSPNGGSAGIYIDHGGTGKNDSNGNPVVNTVTNNGMLYTYGSQTNAVAVYSTAGDTRVINNGTMGGDVLLTNGGGTGCFTNNGTFNAGNAVTVGACGVTNNGVMDIRSAPLAVQGNLLNTAGGRIVVATDFSGRAATPLTVDGNATIAGQVEVRPTLMRRNTVTLATATGSLQLDPSLSAAPNAHLFNYTFDTDGQNLHVTPNALFTAQAAGMGANKRAVGSNLQSIFDSGAAMDTGFTRLSTVADGAEYERSLAAMSGKALGAFGAYRFNSSRDFAMNLYGGCSSAPMASKSTDTCGWGRVVANGSEQKETNDALGYRVDASAFQAGGQLQLSPGLALTGSVADENSRLRDDDGSARVNGDAVLGGVGLLYDAGRLELSGGLDAASGKYRSTRDVAVAGFDDEAKASPKQWQVGAHLRAAYSVPVGRDGFVRPFVEGHAIRVEDKAFTEDGTSPFRLAVEGNADTALIGVAGVELGDTFQLRNGVTLRPFASAAAEFGNNRDWTTTARFADQPQSDSFAVTTAGPGTVGRFAIGADLLGSNHLSLSVQYVKEVGQGFDSNTGLARLTYSF
ncbi:autotransporter outer membrane beta-barrel domain-containing protein [Stenotrophomonas sp. PS02300]|uniref:autotransporter outer membrane beta-barrel domain-containing protein n=1 Tax=Stenotrophomonas sp. PS02300 TaxID=2991426 RepID=UPI00249B93CC|nr:autotransporter outer membrane beta-barrel domain-containing protein [Stenotrophomonas sp. PS02300]